MWFTFWSSLTLLLYLSLLSHSLISSNSLFSKKKKFVPSKVGNIVVNPLKGRTLILDTVHSSSILRVVEQEGMCEESHSSSPVGKK